MLMHDDTVDRTTNGSGCIRNMSFEEVRKLDASCKHPLRFLIFNKYWYYEMIQSD